MTPQCIATSLTFTFTTVVIEMLRLVGTVTEENSFGLRGNKSDRESR